MSGIHEVRVATVRVSVDFPNAEGIWVTVIHVYDNESLADALAEASKEILDNLALDAGRLYSPPIVATGAASLG